MQNPLQKWLALYERGVALWLDVVVACVEHAFATDANSTVALLPPELVQRLRDERVIKSPPPLDGTFPIQCAEHLMPGADTLSRERSRCLGAARLHDYFQQASTTR